jgi:hypothetical protein
VFSVAIAAASRQNKKSSKATWAEKQGEGRRQASPTASDAKGRSTISDSTLGTESPRQWLIRSRTKTRKDIEMHGGALQAVEGAGDKFSALARLYQLSSQWVGTCNFPYNAVSESPTTVRTMSAASFIVSQPMQLVPPVPRAGPYLDHTRGKFAVRRIRFGGSVPQPRLLRFRKPAATIVARDQGSPQFNQFNYGGVMN